MKPGSISPLGSKGKRLLAFLVGGIASGRIRRAAPETFATHSEALRAIGLAAAGRTGQQALDDALQELNTWTRQSAALPKIAALIVDPETRRPAEAFVRFHGGPDAAWEEWWLTESSRAIDFDWSPYLGDFGDFGDDSMRVREEEDAGGYPALVAAERGPADFFETASLAPAWEGQFTVVEAAPEERRAECFFWKFWRDRGF